MLYQNCHKYLAQKFFDWESRTGDLSQYILDERDRIQDELSEDEIFKTLFCDLVSNISEQKNYLSTIIKLARGPFPRTPLPEPTVDILLGIILAVCGRKEESKRLLIGAVVVACLGMLINEVWGSRRQKSKKRRKSKR
jgi:hypothetical protein